MHGHAWIGLGGLLRCLLSALCLSTIAIYVWSVFLAREFFRRVAGREAGDARPGVSVLKPIRGVDPDAVANFTSFCEQDYPSWEILFGAEQEGDPGLEPARQVQREHPDVPIRIFVGDGATGANPKIRTLAKLAREARYSLLLISDSDIHVDRSHLERMVEPFQDPRVGVATCLYRSSADAFWGRIDTLALSTEFVPAALVARRLEGMTFAMGAGILIRRDVLERIGGFRAIADNIADDYLLGNLPARAGYRVELAREVVDHRLGTRSLRDLIERRMRWNRVILTSRPWSYAGMVFLQGTAAALLLPVAAGGSGPAWLLAMATLATRIGAAWFLTDHCLDDRASRRLLWLLPICDVVSTLTWFGAFFGREIVWRGRKFWVERGGRLLEEELPARAAPR
jgi:ceramide glucosyltransferase